MCTINQNGRKPDGVHAHAEMGADHIAAEALALLELTRRSEGRVRDPQKRLEAIRPRRVALTSPVRGVVRAFGPGW